MFSKDAFSKWCDEDPFRAAVYAVAALLICIFLSLVLVTIARAADVGVSWTNPTTNTDGSAIPATGVGSLTGTRVEYGSCSGSVFGTKAGEVNAPAPATSTSITGLSAAQTYCFRSYAKNTYGSESAASNVASKALPAPTPNPPVLSSTVTVAWDLKNGKPFRVVGRIALGTPCGDFVAKKAGERYYQIDRSAVKFIRKPQSARIVTQCAIS